FTNAFRADIKWAGTSKNLTVCGVDHVAQSVNGNDSSDDNAASYLDAGCTQAGFHGLPNTQNFSNGGAHTGPYVPLGCIWCRSIQARLVSQGCIRADFGVTHIEVKKNGGGDNRDAGYTDIETDLAFFQVAHHATG